MQQHKIGFLDNIARVFLTVK